jgi:hypothetical protein
VTKKWMIIQPERREPILIQPTANLEYGHSKRCENEYLRRRFFVETFLHVYSACAVGS